MFCSHLERKKREKEKKKVSRTDVKGNIIDEMKINWNTSGMQQKHELVGAQNYYVVYENNHNKKYCLPCLLF